MAEHCVIGLPNKQCSAFVRKEFSMAMNAENNNQEKITALYCRLSVEDIKDDKDKKRNGKEDESNSISNQDVICRGWFLPPNTIT